jgi:hypothetical protein
MAGQELRPAVWRIPVERHTGAESNNMTGTL